MPFDEDPQHETECYPCPECPDGDVTLNGTTGGWECNECDFDSNGSDNGLM